MNAFAVGLRAMLCFGLFLMGASFAQAEHKVVAYVPNWVDLKSFSEKIDYAKVTHINIAFENPTNEKGDLSFHKNNELLIAKAHANKVKVLVSIGGGAAATNKTLQTRYFDLISEPKRADFCKSLAEYVKKHDFDGLDVDIEGPSINKDYGAFIEELAKVLQPAGKLVTAALSQGYGGANVPGEALAKFDFVNIMAYDGAGPWNLKAPGQHSSMELAKKSTEYWIKRGLPASKAILGVPFYGYGFGEAGAGKNYTYASVVRQFPGAESKDEAGKTIWYNGIPTIKAKTQYAIDQKLGGIMIWSLDNDAPGDKSLLNAIDATYREHEKK